MDEMDDCQYGSMTLRIDLKVLEFDLEHVKGVDQFSRKCEMSNVWNVEGLQVHVRVVPWKLM